MNRKVKPTRVLSRNRLRQNCRVFRIDFLGRPQQSKNILFLLQSWCWQQFTFRGQQITLRLNGTKSLVVKPSSYTFGAGAKLENESVPILNVVSKLVLCLELISFDMKKQAVQKLPSTSKTVTLHGFKATVYIVRQLTPLVRINPIKRYLKRKKRADIKQCWQLWRNIQAFQLCLVMFGKWIIVNPERQLFKINPRYLQD